MSEVISGDVVHIINGGFGGKNAFADVIGAEAFDSGSFSADATFLERAARQRNRDAADQLRDRGSAAPAERLRARHETRVWRLSPAG